MGTAVLFDLDLDLEDADRQAKIASEEADIEQFLAFVAETQPGVTEEERQWYIFVLKNGTFV